MSKHQERIHLSLSEKLLAIREKHLDAYYLLHDLEKSHRRISWQVIVVSLSLMLWCLPAWPSWRSALFEGFSVSLVLTICLLLASFKTATLFHPALHDWHDTMQAEMATLFQEIKHQPDPEAGLSQSWVQQLVYLLLLCGMVAAVLMGAFHVLKQVVAPSLWTGAILLYLTLGLVCLTRLMELYFRKLYLGRWLQQLKALPRHITLQFESVHQNHGLEFILSEAEHEQSLHNTRVYQIKVWIRKALMVVIALPLAYIGSLSLAHLSGFGYSYVFGIRLNPFFFAVFTAVILLAEFAFVQALSNFVLYQYSHKQLLQGWQIEDRQQGRPYRFRSQEQLRQELKSVYLYALLGGLLLLIDMGVNSFYFLTQTSIPWLMIVFLTLLQPLVVISIAKQFALSFVPWQLALLMKSLRFEQSGRIKADESALARPVIQMQSIRKV